MVLYSFKWNVHPDKGGEYMAWSQSAIQRTLGAGGVIEFRAYRPVSGSFQVVITYEFADIAAWAAWNDHADVQQVIAESRTLVTNIEMELWGPSPIVPHPIRPGG